MSELSNRLKELRKVKRIDQADLSKVIGVSRVALGKYEKGNVTPQADKLIKIAKHYDVSLDWLCGLTNKMKLKSEFDINSVADFIRLCKVSQPTAITMTDTNSIMMCWQIDNIDSHRLYIQARDLHKQKKIDDGILETIETGLKENINE